MGNVGFGGHFEFFQDQTGHFDYILEEKHKMNENVGFRDLKHIKCHVEFYFTCLIDLIMQKTGRFGSHFEFCHFTNLKHPLMQKITPNLDSTPNLAIEKLGFVYYFEKKFECAHPYY